MDANFFSDPGFMPHIHCYLDKPSLIWTMVTTDFLIGTAYLAISLTLWALIRRIRIQFSFVIVCFGLFIGACGATHFMEIWTLWHPDYWWAAVLKILTAAASVGTGLYLFRLRHSLFDLSESVRLSEERKANLEDLTNKLELRVEENSKKLAASEKLYETLTSTIPQLVWTCNAEGACTYLSLQWEDYTGIPSAEQLDLKWLDRVIHPDDRERTLQHWMGAVQQIHEYDIEYRIRRRDGEYRWFQTRGTPIYDTQGAISYWVGTCTDIQSQKILADQLFEAKLAAERASDAKTQFLANMSHEIRTPIGAITGFTEMLKSLELDAPERQKYTMIIERNSKQLLRLIDDILDLSKVEAGKLSFEKAQFNLNEFLFDISAVMGLKAAENSIEFILKVETVIPDQVIGDQLRLRQILSNVIGNAIKFTKLGRVSVNLSYVSGVLSVDVIDTGIGISDEGRATLFKAFSQADPSLTRMYGGTGLGLILSKKLAEQSGGDLILKKSVLGEGSHFAVFVDLPPAEMSTYALYLSGGGSERKGEATIGTRDEKLENFKILLVEDSLDNQVLISTYLKKTGADIITANDGAEGISKAAKFRPDLILMDIQMPKLDGHEATRRLRSDGFTNPIIALTAHAMREERDRCIESGFDEFLTKPIGRSELLSLLRRYRATTAAR